MSDLDRACIRAWSACVARDLPGHVGDVASELAAQGYTVHVADVSRRMTELRATGALPRVEAVAL